MAVLTINGWTPTIAPGPSAEIEDFGDRSRALDGSMRHTRVAIKDAWDFSTPWLAPDVGKAYRALLSGRGDRWQCEGSLTTGDVLGTGNNSPLWSVKGTYPTGTPLARLRYAVPPVSVISGTVASDPKYGVSCLAIEEQTVNLLPQNVRTGTDSGANTVGWDASVNGAALAGATLTSDAAQAWQGTKALKVVTTAVAGQGVRTTPIAVTSSGAKVAASLYLYLGTAASTVTVYLRDTTAGTNGTARSVDYATYGATWVRVEVTHTTGVSGDSYALCVENTAASAISYWCDGFQIEARDWSTTWVGSAAGATATASASDLRLRLGEVKPNDDLTIMFWARAPIRASAGTIVGFNAPCLFSIVSSGGSETLECYGGGAGAGGATITARWSTGGAVQATVTLPGFAADGLWHHVAVIMRRIPQTGGFGMEAYFDGATAGSGQSATAAKPIFGAAPTLYLGGFWSVGSVSFTNPWNGLVDELVVLPWAAQPDQIAVWATRQFSSPPELLAAGDFVSDSANEIVVLPEVTGTSFEQGAIAGSFLPRLTKVAFKLREK